MDPLNDRWLRIVGILLLMLLYTSGAGVFQQPFSGKLLLRITLTLLLFVTYWHVLRGLIFVFRRRFPQRRKTLLRLLLTVLTGVVAASILGFLSAVLRFWVRYGTLANFRNTDQAASFTLNSLTLSFRLFGVDVFQSVIIVAFYLTLYETLFYIHDSTQNHKRLKQAEQEKEKLRIANLQSQLDALKQQVNPHFLFNSLNVLDSLIEEDPQQARVFLDELSSVYRYLLRSNESRLTPLTTELAFIQSYFHLLKTRHGEGLTLTVAIDEALADYQLPPLTLQLLVENAVKHNVVLPDQPLTIRIETDSQARLSVRNTLQKKPSRVLSNGVGLGNILAKYQMLGQAAPTFFEIDGEFVVTLPLIQPE
nr:histidine kinase [Fibrella aestuarina]